MTNKQKRKLAAILFADIVGYTALMQKDEQQAAIIIRHFQQQLAKKVAAHKGQVVNFYGDGALCTFQIPIDAVRCAMALQTTFQNEPQTPVRIGIHSGTVTYEGDKIFGDSVNITSRIESMGVAGGVLLSKKVRDEVKNNPDLQMQSLGSFEFKNVEEPMEVFGLANEGMIVPKRDEMKGKLRTPQLQKQSYWKPIALVIILALVFFTGYSWFTKKTTKLSSIAKNAIAIFPFDVKGSTDIQYLGEGMVDLISTKLDDMPAINSIDPNLIFSKLEKESQISRKLDEAIDLANSFEANQFILGNIVEIDSLLRISATIYDASGKKIDTKIVEGKKEGELVKTVDKLVKKLLEKEFEGKGDELSSLGAITSNNLPSLKAYLKGEQAFRAGQYTQALSLYKEATDLDSTFAFAWMQYHYAGSWTGSPETDYAIQQWEKYIGSMPKKWQEFKDAFDLYLVGNRKAIPAFKKLIQQHGENRTFLNGLGEYYFHFNHVYGKPTSEAKPYLEKTLDMDEHNMEAATHLAEIAYIENDSSTIRRLLTRVDEDSEIYMVILIYDLLLRDTVLDEDLVGLAAHPHFQYGYSFLFLAPSKNRPLNFQLFERFIRLTQIPPEVLQQFSIANMKNFVGGQDTELIKVIKETQIIEASDGAVLIADSKYMRFSELYETSYNTVKDHKAPKSIYAAIKYAMVLNKMNAVKKHKARLFDLFDDAELGIQAKYFHYSIKAFEARMDKANDLALSYIDSAYLFPTEYHEIQRTCLDKTIIAANIYADKGEYEKAIPYLENLQEQNLVTLQAYATYRLSQWYEAKGDKQTALIKCNFFLEIWENCDEKHQPWLEDTRQRRDRLIAKMQ